jgi:hypothetical protein
MWESFSLIILNSSSSELPDRIISFLKMSRYRGLNFSKTIICRIERKNPFYGKKPFLGIANSKDFLLSIIEHVIVSQTLRKVNTLIHPHRKVGASDQTVIRLHNQMKIIFQFSFLISLEG